MHKSKFKFICISKNYEISHICPTLPSLWNYYSNDVGGCAWMSTNMYSVCGRRWHDTSCLILCCTVSVNGFSYYLFYRLWALHSCDTDDYTYELKTLNLILHQGVISAILDGATLLIKIIDTRDHYRFPFASFHFPTFYSNAVVKYHQQI